MALLSRFLIAPTATVLLISYAAGCGIAVQRGDLVVRVVDARTGQAVRGALVTADYEQYPTNALGQARFTLNANTYDLQIDHPAFLPTTTTAVVVPGPPSIKTVGLYPRPAQPASPDPQPSGAPNPAPSGAPSSAPSPGAPHTALVFGRVTDATGARLANATVFAESSWGIPTGTARTNAVGEYRIDKLVPGQEGRVSVILDGYQSVTRPVSPKGNWRLDFTGIYALKKVEQANPLQPLVTVTGRVTDTMNRLIDGAIIKAESVATGEVKAAAVARHGQYTFKVPAKLTLRFTASKLNHRSVNFVEIVEANTGGTPVRVDFTGIRALDPTPTMEGKSEP